MMLKMYLMIYMLMMSFEKWLNRPKWLDLKEVKSPYFAICSWLNVDFLQIVKMSTKKLSYKPIFQ